MTHEFEVWQGDETVAAVSSGDRLSALREISHYVAVYSQEGECSVVEVTRKPIELTLEMLTALAHQDIEAVIEQRDLP